MPPTRRAWPSLLAAVLLSAAGVRGAVPEDAVLEARGATIGEIRVRVGDIFDPERPGESGWLYRLANRLHIDTREEVIRRELLFAPGDRYSRRILEESERLLRAHQFLVDAEIRPVRYRDNRVDVEVRTRDGWSLNAGVGFHRSGGENATSFKAQDLNFLGTGRDVTIDHDADVDRDRTAIRFRDLNLRGTRARLELQYGENSDGGHRLLDLERPFFSFDSRWAGGGTAYSEDRVQPLYDLGRVTDRFAHDERRIELFAGWSPGLDEERGRVLRWTAGFTWEEDRFSPVGGWEESEVPEDRTLSYPWVGIEWVESDYLEAHDLDQMGRTEDLHLGASFSARFGLSAPAWGGDDGEAIFAARYENAFRPGRGQLFVLAAGASGRWGDEGAENALVGGELRFYWRNFGEHLLFVRLGADLARDLDGERQLLLGGDSGLRGYPLRYQDGDRRFLLTVEQRLFTDLHLFNLVHVGGAVFLDVGRSWFGGADGDAGVLRDAGIGLRLASSRSSRRNMIHFDVAMPLDGDPSIRRLQWLVSTSETF